MVRFGSIVLTVGAAVSSVQAYANPGSCSGACVVHDPSLIRRSDGTYFRFSTGNEISIASASAITGPWTALGSVVPGGSSINLAGNTDLWAPDVHLIGSSYYLYYAVSTFGSQASSIGLATSSSMAAGTWTDHGAIGVSSSSGSAYNAIDPNFIQLASGAYQMNFGSFWGDIYSVPMSRPSAHSSGSAVQLAYQPTGTHPREGSYMYYRAPYYYLFFSEGICCGYDTSRPASGAEYKIKVCRSTSSTSGFVDASGTSCTSGGGTVVLESHGTVYGPGGQGVYADPTHGAVLYYHYVDTTIGYADGDKQFGWNVISWSTGWPVV